MASVPHYYSLFSSPKSLNNNSGGAAAVSNPRTRSFSSFKFKTLVRLSSSYSPNSDPSSPTPPEISMPPAQTDPVKLAFAKAKAYKKSVPSNSSSHRGRNYQQKVDTDAAAAGLFTTETDKEEYEKNKGVSLTSKIVENNIQTFQDSAEVGIKEDGLISQAGNGGNQEVSFSVELAIDKRKDYKNKGAENEKIVDQNGGIQMNPGYDYVEKSIVKNEKMTISSIDFKGLGFSDTSKTRGLPAGLVPVVDPFPEGDLPEVEIIVGDTSNFGDVTASKPKGNQDDTSDVYKPKVSTWGVFPRPSNISKTYGGGRVIRPGEVLETVEDKAEKEARTRKLLAAYKRKTGLSIDAKLKSECEKAMKDGDSLMDLGKLKQALPYYEKVMEKLPFQSELHGLAALQWSICQDSLSRANEARVMYEKLQSHPNFQVSKKAKQFMFGFQAMEMMKVRSLKLSQKNTGYQNYFEAFVEDKTNYPLNSGKSEEEEEEEEEGAPGLSQALPYIVFLVSPIFIVPLLAAAVHKGM